MELKVLSLDTFYGETAKLKTCLSFLVKIPCIHITTTIYTHPDCK